MRRFTEAEVRQFLPMKDAIEVLRRAFLDFADGRAVNQPRRRLILENGSVLHSMAGASGRYFGTKIYTTNPKWGANFTALLYDSETARPLAEFEANALGQIRTGAASGLAAALLTPERPLTAACIGAGFQAWTQMEALVAVRELSGVKVWSRSPEKRECFAAKLGDDLGLSASAASSAADAAADADVLVTATWAKDPVIAPESVPPGCVVIAMGSNQPQRRELPADLVKSSLVVVDDKEACRIEAGDLLQAFTDSDWDKVVELKAVVAEPEKYRHKTARTVVFKSVGLGIEDVAAAAWVFEKAESGYS